MPSDVASAILPVKGVGLCFDLTCLLVTVKQANPCSTNKYKPPMQVGYASDDNRFASIHVTIVGFTSRVSQQIVCSRRGTTHWQPVGAQCKREEDPEEGCIQTHQPLIKTSPLQETRLRAVTGIPLINTCISYKQTVEAELGFYVGNQLMENPLPYQAILHID